MQTDAEFNAELTAISELVTLIGALKKEMVCEHGMRGQCDECGFAHCEPINPHGILSTYSEIGTKEGELWLTCLTCGSTILQDEARANGRCTCCSNDA